MAENIMCAGVAYPVPEGIESQGRDAIEAWHREQPWYAESVKPAPKPAEIATAEPEHLTEEG